MYTYVVIISNFFDSHLYISKHQIKIKINPSIPTSDFSIRGKKKKNVTFGDPTSTSFRCEVSQTLIWMLTIWEEH